MLLYSTPSIIQSLTLLLREIKELPRVPYSSMHILVHIVILKHKINTINAKVNKVISRKISPL